MAITEVRAVSGYALTQADRSVVLRNVGGYMLVDQVHLPPFSVSGLTGLLAAINKEKSTAFIASQLTFSDPKPATDPADPLNTTVVVTARKSSGYSGSYTFTYSRYALSDAFASKALDLPGVVGTTIWGTLDAINAKFSIKLEKYDVADGPIAPGAKWLTLTTLGSSIYYTPGSTVRLGAADTDIPFATVAPVTNALGFDPA